MQQPKKRLVQKPCANNLIDSVNEAFIGVSSIPTQEQKMTTKPNAIDNYITKSADIQDKIARLQQLAADHFGCDPDAIHWGHVGDLERVQELLSEILNAVAK